MKKHVDLLEILELPQLMELSIREEKYEDALELAAYVQKMGTSFEKVAIVNVNDTNQILAYTLNIFLYSYLFLEHSEED